MRSFERYKIVHVSLSCILDICTRKCMCFTHTLTHTHTHVHTHTHTHTYTHSTSFFFFHCDTRLTNDHFFTPLYSPWRYLVLMSSLKRERFDTCSLMLIISRVRLEVGHILLYFMRLVLFRKCYACIGLPWNYVQLGCFPRASCQVMYNLVLCL